MAATTKKGLRLPVSPKAVASALGMTFEESTRELHLTVLLDRSLDAALLAVAREQLRPVTESLRVRVGLLDDKASAIEEDCDLLILCVVDDPATVDVMIAALKAGVPAVILTRDAKRLLAAVGEHHGLLDPSAIIGLAIDETTGGIEGGAESDPVQLFERLGTWIVRRLPKLALPFARNSRFVRDAYVRDRIQATSLQNAAIAAAFFIPGADLPVLTLNQMKMVLQIAVAWGEPIDNTRLKELAILVASGLGARALARRLVGVVPVFGWAIKAGVGYGVTFALGEAAVLYFRRISAGHEAGPNRHEIAVGERGAEIAVRASALEAGENSSDAALAEGKGAYENAIEGAVGK
ncbi:MAG: hypothetical protein LBI64_01920 [Coriobacteriales bacterium]|jgi:uncharacterized protein (DUF697 family)|nr:hypothetical protein [Coriobacteriales bacterium]